MPDPPMLPVIGLRIAAVELSHPDRQIGPRRLDQEMKVIVHQTVGIALPAVPIDYMGQQGQPVRSIAVIPHDLLPGVAATGHMVDSAGHFNAERSSHERECTE